MKRCYIPSVVVFMALAIAGAMPAAGQPVTAPVPAVNGAAPADALAITGGQLPPLALPTTSPPTTLTPIAGTSTPEVPAALPLAPQDALPPVAGAPLGLPSLPATTDSGSNVAISPVPTITEGPKVYSYGDSNLSIMFLPEQVSKMKDAIREFEDSGGVAAAPAEVIQEVVVAPVEEKIEDPLDYPVFYLASIAYDGPGAWSLWLSGYKITSSKNETDVTVLSVSADSATFLWTPSFAKAMMRRKAGNLFVSTDLVKNRLTGLQRVSFDEATGSVTFTLRPNQSFGVAYFRIFEGYVEGPTLTALPVAVPPVNGGPGSVALSGVPGSASPSGGSGQVPGPGEPSPPSPAPNRGGAANFFVNPSQPGFDVTTPALPGQPGNANLNRNPVPVSAGAPSTTNPRPATTGIPSSPAPQGVPPI